jgi:DNA-binding NtrC family response regulator
VILKPYVCASPNASNSDSRNCTNDQPRRCTILFVEDEPFVRDATSRILEGAGYEALQAEDAPAAIKIFAERSRTIDLLMTDMVLPGQSGLQLSQTLREQSPDLIVLITSGYGNPDYENESPESRTYFLPKPYSKQPLLDKIKKILTQHLKAQSATQSG